MRNPFRPSTPVRLEPGRFAELKALGALEAHQAYYAERRRQATVYGASQITLQDLARAATKAYRAAAACMVPGSPDHTVHDDAAKAFAKRADDHARLMHKRLGTAPY